MNSTEIRSKLQNGETIEEVCQEYGISFKILLSLMSSLGSEKDHNREVYGRTGHLYIGFKNERYIIRKNRKHFGTYRTLDDAVKVRDWFICNGRWDKRWVDRACRECGVTRCRK